ncbi:Transcription initiation factor TFIID subunit 12 [Ascosphaera pollenicola]|nr:Transcription initiation factor TFIID subunit 12 [Ascosphaera pollenicola]
MDRNTDQQGFINFRRGKHVLGVGVNLLEPATSRALPNKRLEIAFGIKNAFTTDEKGIIHHFRSDVVKLLTKAQWSNIEAEFRQTIQDQIKNSDGFVNLASITQSLSLRLALRVLFNTDLSQISESDIQTVADGTNRIWLESKGKACDDISSFSEHVEFHQALRRLCLDRDPTCPSTNPMNLILPAFETMWRVTLRLFLETVDNAQWRQLLCRFASEPTKENFEQPMDGTGDMISTKDVVTEGLYVYPPTRRVHRSFKTSESSPPVIMRGDIEAAHSDENVWANALKFEPARWHEGERNHNDILTFGAGQFTCPAKPVFAPWAVGLLVGLLLSGFEGSTLCIKEAGGKKSRPFVRPHGRLENGREDYLDVDLKLPN